MYNKLKVLDLSRILVGPYSTMLLSDLGAQVIKVESFDGDETRKWGPPYLNNQSTYFISINRNKKSICVDLKKGSEFIKQLASQSDVLVENFTSGVMNRLGLGYDELKQINPKLIYASVNGFGKNNPEPGFDYIMQAETGFMHITGEKEREPMKVGVAIIDVLTALYLSNGIQAALYERTYTGQGCHIQTSLYQSALASLVNVSGMYLNGGQDMHRMGNQHPSIAPYGTFKIKDQYIVIGVAQDNQFKQLCNILNLNDIPFNPKFKENKARVVNRQELQTLIENALESWNVIDLIRELKAHKVPVGQVKSVGQCLDQAEYFIQQLDNGEKHILNPLSFSNVNLNQIKPAPKLNEHRDEVCRLYNIENIERLIQQGVLKL